MTAIVTTQLLVIGKFLTVPGCDFNEENADLYECFVQSRFEFFDDLPGPLQEGWWYYAYLNNNGDCIVADEG